MEDLNIVDNSFELWHNSDGRNALYNEILDSYPSEFNSFDVLNFEGTETPTTPVKKPVDWDKFSQTAMTTAGALGSVATTVQAFKGDGTKSTRRKDVKEVCGRKPLLKKKRKEYDACVKQYNANMLAQSAPPPTSNPEERNTGGDTGGGNEGMSTTKKILIGVGALVLIGGGIGLYFAMRGRKA